MKKHSIGIMQGRLTPRRSGEIQFFPFDNWQKEFEDAKELGLDEIEFIFDYDQYEQNPLWSAGGVSQLDKIMTETAVKVKSVCFDYFMRRPFYKYTGTEERVCREENLHIVGRVLKNMGRLGIELLEIPLVDNSSLKTAEEKEKFIGFLRELTADKPAEIKIGLETDLPPAEFRTYLESIAHTQIGANYDSGNSSGLGYQCREEILTLKEFIFNVHIKDRMLNGPTVTLGTGNAHFDDLFSALKKISYSGSFILQAARGEDFKEKETIQSQKEFIESFLGQ